MEASIPERPHTLREDAARRYERAYRRVHTSMRVISEATGSVADRELERIGRLVDREHTFSVVGAGGGQTHAWLADSFLTASALALGMSTGAIMMVVDRSHLEVLFGNCSDAASLHFRFGEGPAFDAWEFDMVVEVADFRGSAGPRTRWPAFAPAALESGVRSALCIPLWRADNAALVLAFCGKEPIQRGPRSWMASRSAVQATSGRLEQLNRIVTFARQLVSLSSEFLVANPGFAEIGSNKAAIIQQAGDAISAELSVDYSTALDLLRFQAWAEDRTLEEVSDEYFDGRR